MITIKLEQIKKLSLKLTKSFFSHSPLKKVGVRSAFRGLLMLLLIPFIVSAQETTVVGQILDKTDHSPVPNVNIYFKNTDYGVQSNGEGYFLIRNNGKENTLVFSAIGFRKQEIRIKPGQSFGTQIEMEEENTLLQEVFVIPGANPALELIKKVRMLRNVNDVTQNQNFKIQINVTFTIFIILFMLIFR